MRLLITGIIILFSINTYACECALRNIIQKVEDADFVAHVRIKSVIQNSKDQDYQNLDVELIEKFKGKFKNNLTILTDSSMCNIFTSKNTEWIIFANNDQSGKLSFGYCSGSFKIDKKKKTAENSITKTFDILRFLRNKNLIPKNNNELITSIPNKCLNRLSEYSKENKEFTVFEVTIRNDLSISKIEQLNKFNDYELNSEISKCINSMEIIYRGKKNKLPRRTKKIILVHYYYFKKSNKILLSTWNL